MRKICKIISIIAASMLSVVGVLRLIPSQSSLGTWIHTVAGYIEADTIYSSFISIIFILFGIAILVIMVFDIKGEKNRHSFKVGSKGFCTFFAKWYSHVGTLSIICDDLEGWVNPNGNSLIFDALKNKSKTKELHLFLGMESPSDIVTELRDLGATINRAPIELITNYSFSCLSVMGNHSAVIVRNKQMDKSTNIVFEEISSYYISGLLNTLIKEGMINEKRTTSGNK